MDAERRGQCQPPRRIAAAGRGVGLAAITLLVAGMLPRPSSAQDFYYHSDELHSVAAVSDAAGAVAERCDFEDFGGPQYFDSGGAAIPATQIGNPWAFTSARVDAESGLYYLRHRYLATDVGRFTTRDPARAVDGPNLFAYVRNNPASRTDPLGLWELRCRYLAGVAKVSGGWHCWVECDGKSYSLLNRKGTATPEIDAKDDKGQGWVEAKGDNECGCIAKNFDGESSTYCYSFNDCNSNWFANSLLRCCGININREVAWAWSDCSRYKFKCTAKPDGPGLKWSMPKPEQKPELPKPTLKPELPKPGQ